MDKIIRNIEWNIYLAAPGHTAFKIRRTIRALRSVGTKKLVSHKEKPRPDQDEHPIGLLNVHIKEAAELIPTWYRTSRFLFEKQFFICCRGPPVQKFSS